MAVRIAMSLTNDHSMPDPEKYPDCVLCLDTGGWERKTCHRLPFKATLQVQDHPEFHKLPIPKQMEIIWLCLPSFFYTIRLNEWENINY